MTTIYRKTGNPRAVQLLLGHTKIESTVRYLGIEDDNAVAIAKANAWLNRLTTEELTISQLANQVGVDDGEISRILPLAFLAPDRDHRYIFGLCRLVCTTFNLNQ